MPFYVWRPINHVKNWLIQATQRQIRFERRIGLLIFHYTWFKTQIVIFTIVFLLFLLFERKHVLCFHQWRLFMVLLYISFHIVDFLLCYLRFADFFFFVLKKIIRTCNRTLYSCFKWKFRNFHKMFFIENLLTTLFLRNLNQTLLYQIDKTLDDSSFYFFFFFWNNFGFLSSILKIHNSWTFLAYTVCSPVEAKWRLFLKPMYVWLFWPKHSTGHWILHFDTKF